MPGSIAALPLFAARGPMIAWAAALCVLAGNGLAEPPTPPAEAPERVASRLASEAATALHTENDPGKAATLLARALSTSPRLSPSRWYILAGCRWATGDRDGAFAALHQLASLGYANVSSATGEDFERYMKPEIKDDPRWARFIAAITAHRDALRAQLKPESAGVADNPAWAKLERAATDSSVDAEAFYRQLTSFNEFPAPTRRDTFVAYTLQTASGLAAPYWVYIPPTYDAAKPTPLIVYLHGGVSGRTALSPAEVQAFRFDNPMLEYARARGALLVYPSGHKDFAWFRPEGLPYVAKLVPAVKRVFNVDDDRVHVVGHSDGASGCYTLSAWGATPVASFGAINGLPAILGGYMNMGLRPLWSITGERDDLYLPRSVRAYADHAIEQGARWTYRESAGQGHDWSSLPGAELDALVERVMGVSRAPMPTRVVWQGPGAGFGRVEWLRAGKTRPEGAGESWHPVATLRLPAGSPEEPKTDEFTYGEKWGAVRARLVGNRLTAEVSRLQEVRFLLSPELIDFAAPVVVTVNGVERANAVMPMNKDVMWREFSTNADRRRVWVAEVVVELP